MIRILLNYLLPLLLPLLIYLTWVWFNKKNLSKSGVNKPVIRSSGIFISGFLGIVLMLITLLSMAFIGGSPPGDGKYESPRLKNGKIIAPKMY